MTLLLEPINSLKNTWHESVFASSTHQTHAPWKAWCSATRWRCSTSLWLNASRAAALRYPAQGCRGGRPGWARWWSHRGCRYGPLHPAGGRIKPWANQQFNLFSFIQMCSSVILSSNSFMLELLVSLLAFFYWFLDKVPFYIGCWKQQKRRSEKLGEKMKLNYLSHSKFNQRPWVTTHTFQHQKSSVLAELCHLQPDMHKQAHCTCRGTPTLLPISLTTEAVTAVVA